MNERIRELIKQAENYAAEQNDLFGVSYKKEYDQKFAELLIRECVQRCEDIAIKYQVQGETYAAGKKAGAFECAADLKEHFGVEE